LYFECPDNGAVIKYINSRIQSAKPGLMRKQLRQRDFFFASLSELGPKVRYAPVDANPVLLQHMQDACAANSLGGRPDEDERVSFPRFFMAGIAKSAVKIDDRFSILPDRYSRTELSETREILFKERSNLSFQFFGIELHLPDGTDAAVRLNL
jgi:hypothetical protein